MFCILERPSLPKAKSNPVHLLTGMDVYVIQQQHNRILDEEKMLRQEEFPLKLLLAILSYKAAAHRDLRKRFLCYSHQPEMQE